MQVGGGLYFTSVFPLLLDDKLHFFLIFKYDLLALSVFVFENDFPKIALINAAVTTSAIFSPLSKKIFLRLFFFFIHCPNCSMSSLHDPRVIISSFEACFCQKKKKKYPTSFTLLINTATCGGGSFFFFL